MEELRKKFIVEEKLDDKRVTNYIQRILPFCKISKDGLLILEVTGITRAQQVKLALVTRFLANHLDKTISAEISNHELSASLNIPRDQIAARLKDLREERFAASVGKGVSQVNPLHIERFILELESIDKKQLEKPL